MNRLSQSLAAVLLLSQALLSIQAEEVHSAPVPLDHDHFPESEAEIVEQIRRHILATQVVEAEMSDYEAKIPQTGAPYSMVAIPRGEVLMGSPESETGRNADEGPQYRAKLSPFWIGKFEVTWDEFEPFMITSVARRKDGTRLQPQSAKAFAGLISSPTTPYTEMSFGMGTDGFPAVCMTHHAASKFCQWLSAQTGHFYRLPTEAEWEYACRAGTTTPYWFGNDPEKLMKYEVIDPHQIRVGYEKIGIGEPNPWGLYDMHGNVMEWCLDRYVPDRLAALRKQFPGEPGKTVFIDPYIPATTRFMRSARGGSWYDYPELCRSASRVYSSLDWMVQDAQLPKSLWYLTDAQWLGFRLVRPLEIPSAEEMMQIWNSGNVHHKEERD
ncbi:MAG: formylglycine-generating enzyme family protein [Verrucomicrobiales bacterium]|nr:formylglycine-generating enzyme family protein [Verrucomicrobiales bacterium]